MAKKKIITQHCPCCDYTYQLTTFFRDEVKVKKVLRAKEVDGQELISRTQMAMINFEFLQTGVIMDKFKDSCEVIENSYTVEEKDETKITQGKKPFKRLPTPNTSPMVLGGPPRSISYLGMFCPECGVFLNIETCTTTTEEKIE